MIVAMPGPNFAPLVHLVGFLTGAALYALLLSVATRRPAAAGDRLPLLTAILGLIWNLSGLAAYAIRDFAGREPSPWLMATAYSALGFLPAVVVHSVLRSDERHRARPTARAVIWLAYIVSTVAEGLMFWAARTGRVPSSAALEMLTWSYAALAIPVLFLTRRRGSIVALAFFAVTALHLSHPERQGSLVVELIGHHASIPLIFAILYQDFRFALADVFLKRALTLSATIALSAALYFGIAVPVYEVHDFRNDPVAAAVAIVLSLGIAMLYPRLARASGWFVDRVVLRRPDYARVRGELEERLAGAEDEEEVLGVMCGALRPALAAEVRWTADDAAGIELPTTEGPRYALAVGAPASGRQLLSDDDLLLKDVAVMAARRIDAIRLAGERERQRVREQEISKLATEAELRALRAQVNPHFLFNALNTIGFLIQTSPARAHVTLMKLTALLRGVLRTTGGVVTLGEEVDLIAAYLEIERARFEERLEVTIDVPDALRAMRVPPLVLQPLVENAIKHGVARSRAGGAVRIEARSIAGSLVLTVANTGARAADLGASARRRGVGLTNVEERLRHQYGAGAHLTLSADEASTVAEVVIPLARIA
jgi:two-component system LytT family sensor kinase